jgi:hypothetical protein
MSISGPIRTLAIVAIIFFGVGEFLGGWYLGVVGHTPTLLYKKDYSTSVKRTTFNAQEVPIRFEGTVHRGSVSIEATFERGPSFQAPSQAIVPEHRIYSRTFETGERINLREVLRAGQGTYRVYITYRDATGVFRLHIPPESSL